MLLLELLEAVGEDEVGDDRGGVVGVSEDAEGLPGGTVVRGGVELVALHGCGMGMW